MTIFEAEDNGSNVLIAYWNKLPNVRHHKAGTKTCKAIEKWLKLLHKGWDKKYSLDPAWKKKYNLTDTQIFKAWTDTEIRQAMVKVDKMCSPGYYPGYDSYLRKTGLLGAIYNDSAMISWLTFARYNEPILKRNNLISLVKLTEDEKIIAALFVKYGIAYHHEVIRSLSALELKDIPENVRCFTGSVNEMLEGYCIWLKEKGIQNASYACKTDGKLYNEYMQGLGG